jgi:hypothetical protein
MKGYLVLVGWAAGLLLLVPISTRAEEPQPGPFEVVLVTLKNDWQGMRYHRQTGESWYALKGDWKPVPEAGEVKPPEGQYKLFLTATGDHDWIALRVERKSGRSWRLAALKWIEMKVLDPDELPPQQPQPFAELEAE